MRLIFCVSLLLSWCVSVVAQPGGDSPVDHMNYLGQLEENLSRNYLSYMSEVAHGNRAKKMEKRRMELLNSVNEAIRAGGQLRPYKGDASLRDAYKQYWTVLLSIFKEDYAKLVNLEEVAEQSYDEMEAFLLTQEKAGQKLNEAYQKIPAAYETFAGRHNVRLTEGQSTKLSQRLDQAGKVNSYMNKVYLLFFKSHVQEGLMLDALAHDDINGVEQSKNSMGKFSIEGLQKLDTLKPFKGDESLMNACRKVLEFQKDEAENKAGYMTEFLIKKGDFDKIKKSFDAKPANKRTQADIDTYNKAIDEYNDAIKAYNKSNDAVNAARAKVLDNWETTRKQFMHRHIPYKV